MDDFIYWPVGRLAQAIRSRELSSFEVVTRHLERIAEVNPLLNAVVQLTPEMALSAGRRADEALAQGDALGPLHGVPMTIKDSFDTAGVISTWGTMGRANFIPENDATVVKRLKEAGAILLGKTNTPEFTLAHETDNRVYGRTNNPYALDRSPGGSSGGAAAIVASGGAPFDIGTDTGGSIRNPAHFCGLAGIKPTSGRVPRTGHAVPPGGVLDWLTQVGPIGRFVDDLVRILPLISGPDPGDPFIAPVPLRDPAAVDLAGLRGAFFVDNGIRTPIPEIVTAVRQAVDALSELGIDFDERRPPGIEETIDIYPALFRGWDGGAWVRSLLAEAGTKEEESALNLEAKESSPAELVRLIDRWDQFRVRMLAYFQAYDFLIAPVNACAAIRHGTYRELYAAFSYTMSFNLTGWPSATVRVGTSDEGLPIGVQIAAHPWREDVALAAAEHLEKVFSGWHIPSLATG